MIAEALFDFSDTSGKITSGTIASGMFTSALFTSGMFIAAVSFFFNFSCGSGISGIGERRLLLERGNSVIPLLKGVMEVKVLETAIMGWKCMELEDWAASDVEGQSLFFKTDAMFSAFLISA